MDTCPFCNLDQTGRVLAQDELAYVIFSDPRLMPGHLLVIPRRHVSAIWELSEAELVVVWRHLSYFGQKLISTGLATGYDIRQNYRPFLPDSRLKRSHFHVHLLPRTLEDTLYRRSMKYETELFTELPAAERDELTRKLIT